MGYTIAVAGKGGTGKTTVASLLISLLSKQNKSRILGIDADPNSNLAETLGLEVKEDIGTIVDSLAKNPQDIPAGMTKDMFIDFRIQTNILEEKGFDLLTMGRPEGPGCYCYVNNLLRALIKKITDNYDYIVIDNEAGFEHLSRRTMRRADMLLVVSDSSEAGLKAAKRIVNLTKELDIEIKQMSLVLNRINAFLPKDKIKALGIEIAGIIPEDEQILNLSLKGKSINYLADTSKSLIEIKTLLDKIINSVCGQKNNN